MNTPNLHSSLSVITIEKLRAYLAKNGWSESFDGGRLNFSITLESDDLRTVFVPADGAHPKFRSLLQNLLFSLAVAQSREPADIADEIASFPLLHVEELAQTGKNLPEIASLVRGLAQECSPTEQAKGKILELARYLLASQSLTLGLTPKLADQLWEVARADQAYLPAATAEWLQANAQKTSTS